MGYAYYELHDGRPAGYGVEAICDQDGCDERIDRGLAYLCGDEPATNGDEEGCGGYFCGSHLLMAPERGWHGGICRDCSRQRGATDQEDDRG